MHYFYIFSYKYFANSKKSSTFARFFREKEKANALSLWRLN